MINTKPGRNDACSCGSGKKYKHCCGRAEAARPAMPPASQASPAADRLLQAGLADHQAGRLEQAVAAYRQILAVSPRHPHALHLLGIASTSLGKPADAVDLIGRAIEADATVPFFYRSLGNALHVLARYDEEIEAYRKAVSLKPDYAEAYSNMGDALQSLKRFGEAVGSYDLALRWGPRSAQAHYSRGDALLAQSKSEAAAQSYRAALEIDPNSADAWCNLGLAVYMQGDCRRAAGFFEKALALKPDHAEAANNLGNALKDAGEALAAERCFRRVIEMKPGHVPAWTNLANILRELGENAQSLACFEKVLEKDPENPLARHMVAAMKGEMTERAPDEYVENLFDDYAAVFDDNLQEKLKYRVPLKLATMAARVDAPAGGWDILDMGCGTGLAGVAFAPFARSLTGVDLSARMLAKAAERNLYRRLEKADLLTALKREPDASYDAVVAADVFIYVGRLDEVVPEARRVLRPHGFCMFSVESVEAADDGAVDRALPRFLLRPSGRYAHSRAYVEELAEASGFEVLQCIHDEIRCENEQSIPGWLVTYRLKA